MITLLFFEFLNFFILYIFKSIINNNVSNIIYYLLKKKYYIITKFIKYYNLNTKCLLLTYNKIINKISTLNIKSTLYKTNNILIHKILTIKTTSKVTKGGIKRKFNSISIIGNQHGWLGIGKSKNYYLSDSIDNSFIKSFYNIKYIPITKLNIFMYNLNSNLFAYNIIKHKSHIYNTSNKLIQLILNILGIKNIMIKCIKKKTYLKNLLQIFNINT